jgi:two-component system sensor histidine kinase QseC
VTSLRRRLFALLLVATGAIWLSATAWIYVGSRSELEHVLDTRLQEAARMVHSLVSSGNMATAAVAPAFEEAGYARQLSCQIWSFDGRLLARSSGAPLESLAEEGEGFADQEVKGESWRVYTIVDADKGVRVAVGDRIGLRDRLVRDLVAGLIWPAVLIVPLLGILLWLSLGRGLAPLNAAAREIAARDGEDMRPIDSRNTPAEIRPLLASLNGLFGKVEAARRHQRDITAFAAHELRTPLAGLKTQAQVALTAPDDPTRNAALQQIVVSVHRTTRLTRQLLALAKLEAMPESVQSSMVGVSGVLRDVIAACATPAGIEVEIAPELEWLSLPGDVDTLHLVLRNLHENAVEHARSRVSWSVFPGGCGMVVEDDGPGLPDEELPLITKRFYRGRHKSLSGSGLGLTIAEMASSRLGATLGFCSRADALGLRVLVRWKQ